MQDVLMAGFKLKVGFNSKKGGNGGDHIKSLGTGCAKGPGTEKKNIGRWGGGPGRNVLLRENA